MSATGSGSADATDARIVASARDEFVRYGIRRGNVEEIARRAGVSRVTVYRRFESKAHLLRAVIMGEVADFAERFDAAWYGDAPVADRIVDACALAVVTIRRHPLLNTVMRSEPDVVLRAFTLEGEAEFEMVRGLLAARIDGLVDRGEIPRLDVDRAAEVIMRITYSVVLLPFGLVPGRSDADIRAFVRDYVAPFILAPRG